MQEISLLNSVIGPVMRGPSSSHCAAPYMMAKLVRELSCSNGEVLQKAVVRFDPRGSFAPCYKAQSSDENFAAGLYGAKLTDADYRDILGRVERGEGFHFAIEVTELDNNNHPNRVDLELTLQTQDGGQRTDLYTGASVGGGMYYIDSMNGEALFLTGKTASVFVWGEAAITDADTIAEMLAGGGNMLLGVAVDQKYTRIEVSLQSVPAMDVLGQVVKRDGVTDLRFADASQYPVCAMDDLFSTSDAVIAIADQQEGGSIADAALALEAKRLGLSRQATRDLFRERCELMLRVVAEGFDAKPEDNVMRFLTLRARKVRDANLPDGLGGPVLQDAIAGALSAMERDSNRGLVCAAPTAGSAGVVPGTLYGLIRHGIDIEGATDALQVMALIGAVFAARGTFAAECGGCSVETGASAAMAAAGVTQAYGGSAKQCFDAASMCLMNTLGLVCDPVGGDVEIPCHARNVAGVSHAFSSAMAVLAGFDAVLGYDELVDQTVKIGAMMHPDLRCTARGGCAATKTAFRMVEAASLGK
ncbi:MULTISPECIES: L-serine ammonia-lyase, iron-sulfur-dependent, subunit alpha [unclassified Thalassospira]|uniref:L-serine ammonia-lyase, iron-sulfur-dependent, subunit alpha n=1 Tax=unclassified Thalassospira TaxID=2648997 RepID=UPI001B23E604|nr:L-serine ammonia-lyase, iron-sulfur-dependent, subunit alpha [Thalassospira sp.]MBO6770862.1 L-serine ammonia-lyase, iron-sulfur-dependent, subunit alpha [Thalassospira sp.]